MDENFESSIEIENQVPNNQSLDTDDILQADKWVLVKFATKKTLKHYVGKIEELKECGSAMVKFVRKCKITERDDETRFSYPPVEDIYEVTEDDILCILPKPILGRRGELIFKKSFYSYNIQ